MHRLAFTLLGFLLIQQCAAQLDSTNVAPAGKDLVIMNNGTRIIGKIISIIRGQLVIDGDDTNDITIDLKNIKTLVAQRRFYRIQMLNDHLYVGTVGYSYQNGKCELHLDDGTHETIAIMDIFTMAGFERGFLKQLDGNVNLGYSFTKSSDITRFNVSNNVKYTSSRWVISENASGIYTVGDGNGFEKVDATFGVSWIFRPRWSNFYALQYQRILETGIRGRVLAATGIGRQLVQSRHVSFTLASGISSQKEFYTDGTESNVQAELPLLASFYLYQLKKPDIDIYAYSNFYYNLSISGRYRFDQKLDFSYEIVKDFVVSLELYFNYDSKPQAANTSTNDYGTVFSIGYKF